METNIFRSLIGRQYLVLSAISSLASAFMFATYVLFLNSKGMNLWQINIINSGFMATIILAELPTGSFADVFGRKKSIVISQFLLALSALMYFLASSFWYFLAAEIVGGIALTFSSGALEAWAVDSLKQEGKGNLKGAMFRYESLFASTGVIAGSLIGAYVGKFNLAIPWLLMALFAIGSGIYAFKLAECEEEGEKAKEKSLIKQMSCAWNHGLKKRNIVMVAAFGALLSLAVQSINMDWSIFFTGRHGLNTEYMGWIFAGIALSQAGGGLLAKKTGSWFKSRGKSLAAPQLVAGVGIIALSVAGSLALSLSAFFVHEIARGFFKPVKQDCFNDLLVPESRATILSLDSMIMKIGSFIGLIGGGFLAHSQSIPFAWLVSGIFLVIGSLVLGRWRWA